jgi:hypothetical protein
MGGVNKDNPNFPRLNDNGVSRDATEAKGSNHIQHIPYHTYYNHTPTKGHRNYRA